MLRQVLASVVLAAATWVPGAVLDDGRLDPDWFGGGGVEFRETDGVDYVWLKPGFTADGHTFWVKPWEEPAWLGKDRSTEDAARAEELTKLAHPRLKGALATALRGKAKASLHSGDVIVQGRLVDVKAVRGARFSGTATWDIKFMDAKSGELLLAIHHRAMNANFMSDLPTRIWKWMGDLAADMRYDFPDYPKAKPRRT